MTPFAKTCPSKLSIEWSGAFTLFRGDVDDIPPDLAGVYILCTPSHPGSNLTPFYVGQTTCLHRRLTEHLVGYGQAVNSPPPHIPTYFFMAALREKALRTSVTTALNQYLLGSSSDDA